MSDVMFSLSYFPLTHHFNIVSSLLFHSFLSDLYTKSTESHGPFEAGCYWLNYQEVSLLLMKFIVKINVCILRVLSYFKLTLNSVFD